MRKKPTLKEITRELESIWYDRIKPDVMTINKLVVTEFSIDGGKVHLVLNNGGDKVYDTTLGNDAMNMYEGSKEDKILLAQMLSADLGVPVEFRDPRNIIIQTGPAGIKLFEKWITEKYSK